VKQIIEKIKRRSGIILLAIIGIFVITNPTMFITLGGDAGYKIFTATWSLILAYLAISQMDRHWSHPNEDKKVSLSNFMNEASNDHKMVIYATLFIAVAIVLAAVISS